MKDLSCCVDAIPAAEYPTPAKNPSKYLILKDKLACAFGLRAAPWQTSLRQCVESL